MADKLDMKRRGLFGAVAVGATAVAATATRGARAAEPAATPAAHPPSTAMKAAEAQPLAPREMPLEGKAGSDFMVDVIKSLPVDYITTMPGSTFRGLHESIVNYGGNKAPELITCLHEEVAVGMGHGYAKVAGKPLAALVHGVVGVQHASMAIYNAWADRAPVIVMIGNTLALEERRPGVEWTHSAQDNAALIRDFTKWDDMPVSLPHFAESTVRAWQIAMTPPFAPTAIVVDGELAENPIHDEPASIVRLSRMSAPVGDPAAIAEAAKLLADAQSPVIMVDRAVRTAAGMADLVAIAELLGAPVIDKGGRMNFPSRHPLNAMGRAGPLLRGADVVIGIEVADLFGAVNSYRDIIHRDSAPMMKPGSKLISLSATELLIKANLQDFQRYQPVDLAITGDGEASLPLLRDALSRAVSKSDARDARAKSLGEAAHQALQRARQAASYGWDARPISVARICMEVYGQIKNDDWALTTGQGFQSDWPIRLWDFTKPYQHIGDSGGYGVGYSPVAAAGAALAHRDVGGRLPVTIIGDGELMCAPTALWTLAHHRIPLLLVVHNNRAYHQEVMHVERMAARHGRPTARATIGTTMTDPNIDFAKLAASLGVWSIGPIEDPAALGPALKEAVAMVKSGHPALVDVVSQAR